MSLTSVPANAAGSVGSHAYNLAVSKQAEEKQTDTLLKTMGKTFFSVVFSTRNKN